MGKFRPPAPAAGRGPSAANAAAACAGSYADAGARGGPSKKPGAGGKKAAQQVCTNELIVI